MVSYSNEITYLDTRVKVLILVVVDDGLVPFNGNDYEFMVIES